MGCSVGERHACPACVERGWELCTDYTLVALQTGSPFYCHPPTCPPAAVERGRELRADYKLIARALTRKGNALVKQGKLEEAIAVYRKSLTEHRCVGLSWVDCWTRRTAPVGRVAVGWGHRLSCKLRMVAGHLHECVRLCPSCCMPALPCCLSFMSEKKTKGKKPCLPAAATPTRSSGCRRRRRRSRMRSRWAEGAWIHWEEGAWIG